MVPGTLVHTSTPHSLRYRVHRQNVPQGYPCSTYPLSTYMLSFFFPSNKQNVGTHWAQGEKCIGLAGRIDQTPGIPRVSDGHVYSIFRGVCN